MRKHLISTSLLILACFPSSAVVPVTQNSRSPHAVVRAVGIDGLELTTAFWAERFNTEGPR